VVDSTGRCIRVKEAGYIDPQQNPMLERLGINAEQWLTLTTGVEQHLSTAVGSEYMLQQDKKHTNHQRIRGMGKAQTLFKRV
jgi:hypothetical protein